ncbi:MAG: hypothetical protein NTX06_07790 [Proteobacteria bacterium]|nr:hypothetical protein [Pseudomonadota bacterium]
MLTRRIDVANESYNAQISRIPELIGKHPGVIAPLIIWKPNPLQFIKPVSASRVSGMMEVELCIREGNEELEKNLKKIILTIDGKRFEFDKPPCRLQFDTSPALQRLINLRAEAIGKQDDQDDAVLASFSTNVIAENGTFDTTKPLLLFAGVFEPKIDNPRGEWTPAMFDAAFTFSKNIMNHLMHYGFVPDFLKEVDMFTALIDPTQLDRGMEEYKPVKLVNVSGAETGPGCDGKTYSGMIDATQWMEKTTTKLGTVLRGYHIPEMGFPNDIPDIYEVFAVHIISNYWKFAPQGGMRAWDQTQIIFKDIMADLLQQGFKVPWDVHSLLIGEKPAFLKEKIKKHVLENGITGIVLCDFIPDLSDFEDTKGMWEDVQEAIDLVEQETGKRLPLSILYTTQGELLGNHPDFAEAAFRITKNELQSCGIPDSAKIGLILGEHGFPPGNGEDDVIDLNMQGVRQNIRSVYERELPKLRKGVTEFRLSMNEFNNHPDSPQLSSMECMIDYLHRGFDVIIFQPYYFINETIDLFEHLRHWAFEVDGIDEKEFHGGHEIANNYRSDFDFRGTRIIITGSLLGRYEKDGNLPLVKEGYMLLKRGIVETVARKLNAL